MMVTQDACIFLCIVCSVIALIIGYFNGKWDKEEKKEEKYADIKGIKLKLIEGIDGVTSVQLTPIRYVELLTKEEEYNELRLKLKDI